MIKHMSLFFLFALLTAIGLVGGWVAAHQMDAAGQAGHEEHGAEPPAAAPPGLDERTLANLGVRVAEAQLSTFTRTRSVQAVVEDRPQNRQPVVAPLGGIITEVHTQVGGVAAAGAPLITLVREPIPRPKPELTADILTPISEDVHTAVSQLRSALGRLRIVDDNLARIRKPRSTDGALPVMRKSEIEYENERARLRVELEQAHHELERHGLSDEEIASVETGHSAPGNRHLWEHALRRGGLWSDAADAIRAQLPETDRGLPWCVVAIGELSAAGLATEELSVALGAEPALAAHFAEAAALLLQGLPLPTVRVLAAQGALAPIVVVRAPIAVDRWDVAAVAVRAGERVAAGQALLDLHDARTMWLRLEPVGEEIGLMVRAFEGSLAMRAVPLIDAAGPELDGVVLQRIDTHGEAGHAFAEVGNTLLTPSQAADAASRSWSLRAGTRYLVNVPVARLEGVFVLSAGALTSRGPDRVVFLRDGNSFRPQVVRVLYEDDDVAVLPADTGLFPGDPVAISGAFALGLALQLGAGSGAVDPHAGHNH